MTDLPEDAWEAHGFRPVMEGRFVAKNGPAWNPELTRCNKKLCFAATDLPFLVGLLHELCEHPQAFFVKFSPRPRDGMYLGRCFFMDEELVGRTWAEYKGHPKVFCSIQNDDFTLPWRESVKNWSKG